MPLKKFPKSGVFYYLVLASALPKLENDIFDIVLREAAKKSSFLNGRAIQA